MARLVASERVLRGMTPQARRQLEAALAGAERAGLAEIRVIAGKARLGHVSHYAGTEWDIQGYDANGKLWSREQRVAVADAARQAGANRFGLYSSGRTLHMGHGPPGSRAINTTWGAGGLTGGEASRRFSNPAEMAFSRAVASGQPFDVASLGIATLPAGADQNTIRLAQEALQARGINVPVTGTLDEATQAGLQTFRSSPAGEIFSRRYGLPASAAAPQSASQPQTSADAANMMAGQPPMLDTRPQRAVPGAPLAYGAEAQPYRGPAPGTNPADMLQPAAATAQMDTGRFGGGAPAPSRFDIADPMARDLQFDPIAPRHLTDTWQNEPTLAPDLITTAPNGQITTRRWQWNGAVDNGTNSDYFGGPGQMNALGLPTGQSVTPGIPAMAGTNPAAMGGPGERNSLGMPTLSAEDLLGERALAGLLGPGAVNQLGQPTGMAPLPPVPSVTVPEGQVPFPRPNPIPVAQRGKSGRTPDGFQWRHIAQRGGPTILEVKTPKGRTWREPLGPPGGMGLVNEYASSFNPVRWV